MQKEKIIKVRRVNWQNEETGEIYDTTKVDVLKRISRTDANAFGYDVVTALVGDHTHFEKWQSIAERVSREVFVEVEMTLETEIKGNGKGLDWFVKEYRLPQIAVSPAPVIQVKKD